MYFFKHYDIKFYNVLLKLFINSLLLGYLIVNGSFVMFIDRSPFGKIYRLISASYYYLFSYLFKSLDGA